MRKLIEFIRSIYVVVLFVVLEIIAVSYYARSSYYTQARLLARSNEVAGDVQSLFSGMWHYFTLGRENRMLLSRVAELEQRVASYKQAANAALLDSYMAGSDMTNYRMSTATVVRHSVNRAQNFMTLNRGRRDGVVDQMAVLSPDGAMAGYVVDCSERYAVVMSVLNTSFRASGKLSSTDYFGSVYWDGLDQSVVVLDDISKYADPQAGQEVVTAGFSQYFPADVLIGWVESFKMNETNTAYTLRVRLAAEMSRLSGVILVENRNLGHIDSLQQSDKINQFIRTN